MTSKQSNGWLDTFKNEHKIASRALSEERASAPVQNAKYYKAQVLPKLLSQFKPRNDLTQTKLVYSMNKVEERQ